MGFANLENDDESKSGGEDVQPNLADSVGFFSIWRFSVGQISAQ